MPVLDGGHRAAADAGHAVRARAIPVRAALNDVDAVDRAAQRALAAADARIRDRERPGLDKPPIKDRVHRPGLEPVERADLRRRERLAALHAGNAPVDGRLRRRDDLRRLLRAWHIEHGDVVFRHDDLQHALIIESDIRAQRRDAAAGVADLAAAGHDKIGLPAAGEAAAAEKGRKNVRDLPAVRRRDEHPRPVGMQVGGRVISDVFVRGDEIVAEGGGEALGNIAAVAGAGVIDDHNTSPKVRFLPSIAHPRPDFQPDVVSARPVCYNGENTATYGRDRICIGIPSGRRSRSRSTRPRRSSPPSCC